MLVPSIENTARRSQVSESVSTLGWGSYAMEQQCTYPVALRVALRLLHVALDALEELRHAHAICIQALCYASATPARAAVFCKTPHLGVKDVLQTKPVRSGPSCAS